MNKQPRILIVDDSQSIRDGLKLLLSTKGYQVIEAEDGEKAIDLVPATNPDLILLDWRMPRFDGFETARRIRALEAAGSMPIILLTLDELAGDCHNEVGPDLNGSISKMAPPDELLSCVEQHLSDASRKVDEVRPPAIPAI